MGTFIPKIIGSILILAGLALLSSGSYKLYLAWQMHTTGVEVSGTVDRLWKKRGGPGRRHEHWVGMSFLNQKQERQQAEMLLSENFFRGLKRGDSIELKYIPGHPASVGHAATAVAVHVRAALIPFVGGLAFLGFAVFLFLRRSNHRR